jgi:nucleoside permease NupC
LRSTAAGKLAWQTIISWPTRATVQLVIVWVVLTTTWGRANFPVVDDRFSNLFLLAVGYGLSRVWPRRVPQEVSKV